MSNLWSTKGDSTIKTLGDNRFLLYFSNEQDKLRIFLDGPWHYENSLIVLVEPKGNGDITKLEFNRITFWIQMHNIPIICMNKDTGFFLTKQVRIVKDLDMGAWEIA